jgi:hypothetical protein
MKQNEIQKAPNEFDFEKTKGFGAYNFVWHKTKVGMQDTSMSIALTRKILLGKGTTDTNTVNYSDLDHVEVKKHFSKGDIIAAALIAILGIVTAQIWAFLISALLIVFSFGKNIVFIRNDGTKVTVENGGLLSGGGMAEFERMVPMLNEKIGKTVYQVPASR